MGKRKTAIYKIIIDAGGNRYEFYCDVSGALVCTTRKTSRQKHLSRNYCLLGKRKAKAFQSLP